MNFSIKETDKKQKALVSKRSKNFRRVLVRLFKTSIVLFLSVLIVGLGAGLGMIRGILDNAPDVNNINVQPEGFQTTIYYQDGTEVKTLSRYDSNRVYVNYDEIPKSLVNAFVSVEDERFWTHNGIDVKGIMRAFFSGVASGQFDQGASTLTQQLIKNNVYNVGVGESTNFDKIERKVQEQYLAIELEKIMTKEEIMEYYLNTINLGHGAHGVEAAANTYFGKSIDSLTISECAVIAGITKSPTKYDPIAHPDNNAKRRKIVLDDMLDQELITQQEYEEAIADDVYSRIQLHDEQQSATDDVNSYFTDAVIDQVIQDLQDEKGYTSTQASNAIYTGGLSIYITQDKDIQQACDDIINDASYYPTNTQVSLEWAYSIERADGTVENISHTDLENYYKQSNSNFNLVFSSEDAAKAKVEEYKQVIAKDGDSVLGETFHTTVQPQASFVIMDQTTGQVLAMCGGRGDKTTNRSYNRATQAARQPGSTFKVLAAFLPALDTAGKTLATVYDDAEYYYQGTNGKKISNWYGDNTYLGLSTIRQAIEYSMNIVAVKCIQEVTPQVAYDYLTDLGFTTLVEQEVGYDGKIYSDIQSSLALGGITNGVTNLELTAAYAAIANQGVYNKPILYTKVVDHDGNVILENTTESSQVMKESTSWLLTNAMEDVVTGSMGTGAAARLASGMPVAGKTGTTSNNYDLWFAGYTPYYTASIWMGYDINTEMENSSRHTRMWKAIMDKVIELKGQTVKDFPACSDIVTAQVCTESGQLAVEGLCDSDPRGSCVKTEYFAKGTEPTETCTTHVKVKVCQDSGLPATEYCPNAVERIYIVRPEGSSTTATADTPYELPSEFKDTTCNIHTNGSSSNVTSDFQLDDNPNASDGPYQITTTVGDGGNVNLNNTQVSKGGTISFTVVPSEGYTIQSITVNGKSPTKVSTNNTYTISNVNTNIEIKVTFQQVTTEPTTTEDTSQPSTGGTDIQP